MYTFIDLFAGIGGFRLALENTYGRCVFSSEIDKHARKVYQDNFKTIPAGDITKIDTQDIPNHNLLFAGFPCQPFSIAGRKQGFKDENKGNLFFELERIIQDKKPKAFLLENVKGLLSNDKGNTIKYILKSLYEIGYDVHYKVLDTQDFGLPQHRERVYIVGFRKDLGISLFNFPEKSYMNKKSIKDILEKTFPDKYIETPGWIKWYNKNKEKLEKKKYVNFVNNGAAATLTARQYASWNGNYLKYYYTEDNKIFSILKDNIKKENTVYQFRRTYVRENKAGVSPTLTANMGTGGHNIPIIKDKIGIRKLTPRECLRLQGFPEGFKIDVSDTQAYKQIGNSVSVPVVEEILKTMLLHLSI